MFKGIGNLFSSAASYLDKSKNSATAEETEAKENTTNVSKAEASSAIENPHAAIGDRKTSEAVMSSREVNNIEHLLQDAIEDEDDRMPELEPDIDFEEEAEIVTKQDAKPQTFKSKATYYSKALDLVSRVVDTSVFAQTITAGYQVVAGSSNVNKINKLIDRFNNNTALSEDLLNSFSKMDQAEFYKLLTSQIIAKNSDVAYYNTFVDYLCKLKGYIESHLTQGNDTTNINNLIDKTEEIIKTVITDAFQQLKENDFIDTTALKDKLIIRDITKYSGDQAKRQFVVEQGRFNTNFKIIHQQQELCNSRDLQQVSNKSRSKLVEDKEIFSNTCSNKITEYILKYNPSSDKELTNAIILELTQSGMALASGIADSLKDKIFNDLLSEKFPYIPLIANDYIRNDTVIELSAGKVGITTTCTFNKGVSLKRNNAEEFISSGPITISYTLAINPNDVTDAEYKDIKINFNNNQS